jgi:predicted RNA-binding protein with PIN domain
MGEDAAARDLPERVRTRLVQAVADALPLLSDVPPQLRRVADFAPARRAKLGATAILAALADDEFRERAATQVAARQPALVSTPEKPDEADPVDVAAAAWLARPAGWQDLVADAVRRIADAAAVEPASEAELARLRKQVDELKQSLREVRADHRERLETLKSENTTLRHKLGDVRRTEKAAVAARDVAEAARAEQAAAADQAAARTDAEIRRLRAQVEEAAGERSTQRKEMKVARDAATVRARLLLDTVVDAATGLRHELSLPPATGAPEDAVLEELEALETERTVASRARPATPARLEQVLGLPRARLVVDGYNVSKTAWPSSTLEAQRVRLLQALAPLVARTGADTTVVFDAASVTTRPTAGAPRGVKVVFSPQGVIADDVIRDLVAAEPEGRVVVVATSDQALARDVARAGARTVPAAALVGLLAP